MESTRVLVVTVADVERDVMLDLLEERTGRHIRADYAGAVPVFAAGAINEVELFVVQAGSQGSGGGAGALAVTASAVRQIAPDYALIVGICYGLRPETQRFGDILVSERIRDLDHGKLVELDGRIEEHLRGETVMPSTLLLNAARAAARTWTRKSDAPVRVGLMLAWNKLVDAPPVVAELRRRHPDAIGGDMEGIGFHAAARLGGVECLLIKGICDFAAGKTDEAQPLAARNAAEFVLHLVEDGALSSSAAQRRGGSGQRSAPQGEDDSAEGIRQSVTGSEVGGGVIQISGVRGSVHIRRGAGDEYTALSPAAPSAEYGTSEPTPPDPTALYGQFVTRSRISGQVDQIHDVGELDIDR
ncbi:hypothetical protein [Nocardia sp. NPDC058705]|uniref:5'-methylthioadenosine/S-adenosylhomocysteine nucleosidase family protein n=1 Tax=Nocardia sp. NPDC058705 TaxID=3346609 RepID=UPI0036843E7A